MTYGRRLVLVIAWLVLIDQFVPRVVRALEHRWYEGQAVFRFENSDLFALGPLVAYLREQPRGERPRAVFFGNSVVWGYGLRTPSTLPARFQERRPDVRVLNVAINGYELGDAYLMAKAIIDSVDRLYVQAFAKSANPRIASVIPVDEEDARAFQVRQPGRVQRGLEAIAGHWRLYANAYRLQAALFGTSTRQYLYLNKGNIARRLLSVAEEPPHVVSPGAADPTVVIETSFAPTPPTPARRAQLRAKYPMLWRFEELVYRHQKHAVFLEFDESSVRRDLLTPDDIADLNAAFAPFGEVVRLHIPDVLKFDKLHLTEIGAYRVAEALAARQPPGIGEPR